MEFFVNDLSIHGQFQTIPAFREAFGRLMALRAVARRHGREIYCHRMLVAAKTGPNTTMKQALQGLDRDEWRAVMSWMTRGGPFWDDDNRRQHSCDDYLDVSGDEIVTDTAVGEAAFRTLHGIDCALVSVTPSDWDYTPVKAVWRRGAGDVPDETADIENWRDGAALEKRLRGAPLGIRKWADLRQISMKRFGRLVFAEDCFEPLHRLPFSRPAAERCVILLDILDKLAQSFDGNGERTEEGQKIYDDYFKGDRAWFSDSSDTEKKRFQTKLTFDHPRRPDTTLFCTWHGKISHMTLRLHYSWSGKAKDPVFIVYAGPKITRQ